MQYYPPQWKVAIAILILKPGKSPNEVPSYRPTCILSIVSKVPEKILLTRLILIIKSSDLQSFNLNSSNSMDLQNRSIHQLTLSVKHLRKKTTVWPDFCMQVRPLTRSIFKSCFLNLRISQNPTYMSSNHSKTWTKGN